MTTRICFLVSGGGGNLRFLDSCRDHGVVVDVELSVVADRECGALDYARRHPDISATLVDYTRRDSSGLVRALAHEPDLVVTSWHKILDAGVVGAFAGRLVNLHYSLLPAFAGLIGDAPVRAAIEAGCRFTGTTCHHVSEEVDAGRIIAQSVVPLDGSLEEVMDEVFRSGCTCLLSAMAHLRPEILGDASVVDDPHHRPSPVDPARFTPAFWEEVARA